MSRVCDRTECRHFDRDLGGCTYILNTGKSRGVKRGNRFIYPAVCDKFERRGSKYYPPPALPAPPSRKRSRSESGVERQLKDFPERDRLYAMGLSDGMIAKETGTTANNIWQWRHARGLPANVGRKHKEDEWHDNQRQGTGENPETDGDNGL